MKAPDKVPESGFYYHYKHDPNGEINNAAYEVLGAGAHTEEEGKFFVIYRPLYPEASVYKAGKMFDVRPLSIFMKDVGKEGETIPRFRKITDLEVIADLTHIRDQMY